MFLSATEAGAPASARGATVESLGRAGGATEAFASGVSFAGILVLVLFIANVAGELSHGTVRTLLMRQPGASACWPARWPRCWRSSRSSLP